MNNREIRTKAKEALKEHFGFGVLASFIVSAIVVGLIVVLFLPIIGFILYLMALFLALPHLWMGYSWLFLRILDGEEVTIGNLFDAFKDYGRNLGLYMWKSFWLFIWGLIGVVGYFIGVVIIVTTVMLSWEVGAGPGIILAIILALLVIIGAYVPMMIAEYRYAKASWLVFDQQQIPVTSILDESKKLMKGKKWQLFCLQLSYTWWAIISIIISIIIGSAVAIFLLFPAITINLWGEVVVVSYDLLVAAIIVYAISILSIFIMELLVYPRLFMAKAVFYRSLVPREVIENESLRVHEEENLENELQLSPETDAVTDFQQTDDSKGNV